MKLAARPQDLPAIARLLGARAASGSGAELVSTYFDTPERTLAARGLVMRVRRVDGGFVQTVKSGSAAEGSALARGEWEDPVSGPWPDPEAPESGRLVPPEAAEQLSPLFRTTVARRKFVLSSNRGTCIEAAIDQGSIEADGGAGPGEPICEVELELKAGPIAPLYDAALELLAVAPLRLEQRSKAERGYRLIAPKEATIAAVHAGSVDVDPGLSGHEALRRIGRACLDQILRNAPAVEAGLADGIHQMRVGVRRLRAILSAFSAILPGDQRRWASGELRWLGNALGAARNLDVFAADIVVPAREALGEHPGFAELLDAAEHRRRAAYDRAREAIASTRYTSLHLRISRWFEICGWRDDPASRGLDASIGEVAARILDRRREVAKRHARGFAKQSVRQRHELRIALKKLRYATELLGGLYERDDVARFVKRIKQLQDDLGHGNDLRVARGIVDELAQAADHAAPAIAAAGGTVLDWHEQLHAKRAHEMRDHLDRLFDTEPFWR